MSSERQEHNEETPWWGEHIHRYKMSFPYLSSTGKILDIACGNGFGSLILSRKTNEIVIGGDISEETVNYCSKQYTEQKNLQFKIVDGTNTPFENNYFDTIISFETIEHTTEYKKMLLEFARILKKGGTLILSTPNKSITSPNGIIKNPYHTQEFTYNELSKLLADIFDEVIISGQRYIRYSEKSVKTRIGSIVERILYLRGVRKLPLSFQNRIMKLLIGKQMYPLPEDFEIINNNKEVIKCKTFFAICKKK